MQVYASRVDTAVYWGLRPELTERQDQSPILVAVGILAGVEDDGFLQAGAESFFQDAQAVRGPLRTSTGSSANRASATSTRRRSAKPVRTSRMLSCYPDFPEFRASFSRFPSSRFPFSASQLPHIRERRDQKLASPVVPIPLLPTREFGRSR